MLNFMYSVKIVHTFTPELNNREQFKHYLNVIK